MKHVDKEEQATKRRQLRTKLGAYNFTSHVILFSFFCSIFISTTQCLAHWGKTYFFFCILLQHPEQCPENLLLMVEVEIEEKKEQPEKQSKSQWAKYSGRQERNRLKQYSMLVKSPVKRKKMKNINWNCQNEPLVILMNMVLARYSRWEHGQIALRNRWTKNRQ